MAARSPTHRTGHARLLTLEGTQNMDPTWGGQMSQIKQNDTGAGATVCLVMCRHCGGVSLRARFLDLFERETLMPFTILVSGGWGMNLSGPALGSTWLLLFQRKCFQFYKELSFIPKKKGMMQAYMFCKIPKGCIPESLPFQIGYWEIPWREGEREVGIIGADPKEILSFAY